MNENLIETLSQAPVFAGCERSTLEELAGHRALSVVTVLLSVGHRAES